MTARRSERARRRPLRRRPRRSPPERSRARLLEDLIGELLSAHEETLRLTRSLLVAQEEADHAEADASRSWEEALAAPGDAEAADTAVRSSLAYDDASAQERELTFRFMRHRRKVDDLAARAGAALSA